MSLAKASKLRYNEDCRLILIFNDFADFIIINHVLIRDNFFAVLHLDEVRQSRLVVTENNSERKIIAKIHLLLYELLNQVC
jgi:hypothetical protein